jgi:hypothetical protein
MSASGEPASDARGAWLDTILVALLALAPSLGSLDAPWIAEDALLLEEAHSEGPWKDWLRSQGGMEIVGFWRPVVSLAWGLQERWTGPSVVPLRAFNLALHAGVVVLALALARRLGAGRGAAFLVSLWVASFPEQGGTSTWLAGRTDLLGAGFLLASVHVALGPRPLLAGPLAFLACASKEFGFLAPLWIGALALQRGERGFALWRRLGPASAFVALAFVWRTLVLGGVGGYSGSSPPLLDGLLGTARAFTFSSGAFILGPLGLLAVLVVARRARLSIAVPLGLALASTALLYPLLADGLLEPQNRRLFFVADCAIALGLAGSMRAFEGRAARRCVAGLALALCGLRSALAWQDTHEWARAARLGEELVARSRQAVCLAPEGDAPVLFPGFPLSEGGAYCLGFGVAARFRPPFPASPRPVWPWRLLAAADPARERWPGVPARPDGAWWPLDDTSNLPRLLVRVDGGDARQIELDERALAAPPDESQRLALEGGTPLAVLEALVVTEHGYEPFSLGALDPQGRWQGSLVELLRATNGAVAAGGVLAQAADLGARRAYLELRSLDEQGHVRASGPWIELRWSRELGARAARAVSAR